MSMLNGRLDLHGVNAEKLANSVLNEALRSRNIALDEFRREDLLADLVSCAWELSLRYDRRRQQATTDLRFRDPGFQGWAAPYLKLRVIDWFRKTNGRTKWQFADYVYERPKPIIVSLQYDVSRKDETDRTRRGRRLDELVGQVDLDPAACSEADLRRALERGDSAQAWSATEEDFADDERSQKRVA